MLMLNEGQSISSRAYFLMPDGRPIEWPRKFFVCPEHKQLYFAHDDAAIPSENAICEICHPTENDSLGG